MSKIIAESPTVTDWISSISSICGVFVAIIAAIFVYVQIRQTAKELRETAKQEAINSEARTRPYVYAEIVPGLWQEGTFDIKIKNTGQSFARNIVINLVEGYFAESPDDILTPKLKKVLQSGFELAPNSSIRLFFYVPEDAKASPSHPLGISSKGKLSIEYSGEINNTEKKYNEMFSFNLDDWSGAMPAAKEGAKRTSGNNKELTNIDYALRNIGTYLAEIIR